jgi:gluconolactonase
MRRPSRRFALFLCPVSTLTVLLGWLSAQVDETEIHTIVAPGAVVQKLAGGFSFAEGPAEDVDGNIYFTDIPNNRIHKWTTGGGLSTFREESGGANGLFFDNRGHLLACAGGDRRLVSFSMNGEVAVLAEEYQGKKLNSPNDLWPDPKGGIYFTDPRYGNRDGLEQDGECVYYLTPGGDQLMRVISDMVRPNGVIGTPDGRHLYVTDHGDSKTFVYSIQSDGTLSGKNLIAPEGSDGMTLDSEGNLYLTNTGVSVYGKDGNHLGMISVPERPTNVCFGGKDRTVLFITTPASIYSLQMRVTGAD